MRITKLPVFFLLLMIILVSITSVTLAYDSTHNPEAAQITGVKWLNKPLIYEVKGQIIYQPSPKPAIITLSNSTGTVASARTGLDGSYTLEVPAAPTGASYSLKVEKAGYLSYTIKNLKLSEGNHITTIDISQLAGDINGDGVVNAEDLTLLLHEFNSQPYTWLNTDIDGSGIVNAVDLAYLLAGFNKHDVIIQLTNEQENFPLTALNGDLVADENTQFIAYFEQDPLTKFIAVSLQVYNGNTTPTAAPLVLTGVSFELSFDSRLSPYRYTPLVDNDDHPYDPTRMYQGAIDLSLAEFKKYMHTPIINFDRIDSNALQNNAGKSFIGATITSAGAADVLMIAPGATRTVAQLYFMPNSPLTDNLLCLDMFNFEFLNDSNAPGLRLIRLSPWIGNGTFFLVGDRRSANTLDNFIQNKQITPGNISQSFKIHMTPPPPAVSADLALRKINGYDATMVWSYTENGVYQHGAPLVLDEGCIIYVKKAATAYFGNDGIYWNYKKYLESSPAAVVFPPAL